MLVRYVRHLTFVPRRSRYSIVQGRADARRSQVATIARALSRAFITINDVEVLKQLVLFAAAGLFVSLLLLTYGVDLSPGFF